MPTKDVTYSKEFKLAFDVLNWDISPEEVISASRVIMIGTAILFLVLTLIFFILGFPFIYPLIGAIVIPLLLAHFITEYPKGKAKLEIMRALGEAPKTITYLVILLKQNPNLEEAVRFSSEFSTGPIADDLKKLLWMVWSGRAPNVKTLLPNIAEKWGTYSFEFKRTIYSIISALSEKSKIRRDMGLDRALSSALEGILFKMRNFVNSLYVPVLVMFSFGTVLPLMFISLLPIITVFGVDMANPWVVGIFLFTTLVGLFFYSNNIMTKRPVSFAPSQIPEFEDFPKEGELLIFGRKIPILPLILSILFIVGFPGIVFLLYDMGWVAIPLDTRIVNYFSLTLVWAVGLSIAVYTYGKTHFKEKISRDIQKVDSELLDVMYALSTRLMEGRPPEEAIYFVGMAFPTTMLGQRLKIAYNTVKKRNTTLEDAFFNPRYGVLRDIYSKTVLSLFKLFVLSAKRGHKVASQMMFTITNHFNELRKVEKEMRNMLSKSMSMLKITVILLAPLISGVVVALYDILSAHMSATQTQLAQMGYTSLFLGGAFLIGSSFMSLGMLSLLIGLYLIGLTIVLIRYIVIIESGQDNVKIYSNIYKIVPLSLGLYTLTIILTHALIGGM